MLPVAPLQLRFTDVWVTFDALIAVGAVGATGGGAAHVPVIVTGALVVLCNSACSGSPA